MPGRSPSKTGVNALMAGHPRLTFSSRQDVDGRVKPGHDEFARIPHGPDESGLAASRPAPLHPPRRASFFFTPLGNAKRRAAQAAEAARHEQQAEAARQDAFDRELFALRRELKQLLSDYERQRFEDKYRPDQPRDSLGRWTDGSSAGGRNDPISDATPDNGNSRRAIRAGPHPRCRNRSSRRANVRGRAWASRKAC